MWAEIPRREIPPRDAAEMRRKMSRKYRIACARFDLKNEAARALDPSILTKVRSAPLTSALSSTQPAARGPVKEACARMIMRWCSGHTFNVRDA